MNLASKQIGVTKNNGGFAYHSKRSDVQGTARQKCLRLILTALLYVICPMIARAQSDIDEYRLKGAFLFHFAQFVEWPSNALTSTDGSLIFCVVGEGPFHGDLEGTVQGKSVAGRTVRIRHIKQSQEVKGCQLLEYTAVNAHEMLSAVSPACTRGFSVT